MTTGSAGKRVTYGIIGLGRIGRRVAQRLSQQADAPELSAILVRPAQQAAAAAEFGAAKVHTRLDSFLAAKPAVTIETASQAALRSCGAGVLASGSDLVPLSLAALADREFEAALFDAAAHGPGRLEIPAGAMGSTGFLAAAREDELSAVTFRAAYPVMRWRGTPAEKLVDLDALAGPACFFRASVREAAKLFPRHINVAVSVALAGLGLDATKAELIADPALTQAAFEIEAKAGPGLVKLSVAGRDAPLGADPADYTAFTLMRALRRRTARVIV